jgi:hypothetical protein
MSAYIVDHATIHAIITWARRICISVPNLDGSPRWAPLNDLDPSEVGQLLLNENVKSVNHRYRAKDVPPAYAFREVHAIKRGNCNHILSAIDIIKCCNCLEYQSCEHPGWERSWAKRFLDHVVDSSFPQLPGYDAAPWGIKDGDVGTVISLSSVAANSSKKRRV